MSLPSPRRRGWAPLVCLAIVAQLFTTALPVVHALAHEHQEAHGHEHHHALDEGPSGGFRGADHHGDHPASLHAACVVITPPGMDCSVAPQTVVALTSLPAASRTPPSREGAPPRSRAPPGTLSTRAPPFA